MAGLVDAVGVLVILGINTVLAAVITRFFRLRLGTRLGAILYSLTVVPVVLLLVVLLTSGVLGLGGSMGRSTALIISIVIPLALGGAIDVFWMPHPAAVDEGLADG